MEKGNNPPQEAADPISELSDHNRQLITDWAERNGFSLEEPVMRQIIDDALGLQPGWELMNIGKVREMYQPTGYDQETVRG